MTQATGIEVHRNDGAAPVEFPGEPRGLLRFALGLRYGAL
jgi:hypothetical protein